jgi:nicotinate phosphoribosyltransferase
VLKLSTGKESWVGPKAVHRFIGVGGRVARDRLAAADEPVAPGAVTLLSPVMERGELLRPHPTLQEIRSRAADQVAALPEPVRRLSGAGEYPVEISPVLRARQAATRAGR